MIRSDCFCPRPLRLMLWCAAVGLVLVAVLATIQGV